MADTIRVKSNLPAKADGGTPCAFWEVDPMHPLNPATKTHEVFVSGDEVVTVGRTPQVYQAIRDERLVEVGSKDRDEEDAPARRAR